MNNEQANIPSFSHDELKESAPVLSGIRKDNPFSVPDGYFDSLNSEVMRQIESLPDFESVSNENPFAVPAGYFDSLPDAVRQRISNKSGWAALAGWISRPVPKYSLAFATFALLVLFSVKFFTRTVHVDYASQQPVEPELLDESVLAQVDESILAEVFEEEIASGQTPDETLENYLLDNDIDLNSITEQL